MQRFSEPGSRYQYFSIYSIRPVSYCAPSLETKTYLSDCHCVLPAGMQIQVKTVLARNTKIYFLQPVDKAETLKCLYVIKGRVLWRWTQTIEVMYTHILYRSVWLFNCQTSYCRCYYREISFICVRGGNFIKTSDIQAVCCFMSDIQTPPIPEHQRTMVTDQTGIEAHPLSCPLGAKPKLCLGKRKRPYCIWLRYYYGNELSVVIWRNIFHIRKI
jgi:hypothetical protein